MLRKDKLVGVGLIAGISCLVANPAQAALFNFSYTFDDGNPGVSVPTVFQGMVQGDENGNNLDNAVITMFEVVQSGSVVADLSNSTFNNPNFTFDGDGVLITSVGGVPPTFLPLAVLADGNTASYTSFPQNPQGTTVNDSGFARERWVLEAKSVPEGNMSVVSWLALAGIGSLSVKYGKRKSL